jgi:hypothetical protein
LESAPPEKVLTRLKPDAAAAARGAVVDPYLSDETLKFGVTQIGPGRAFDLNDDGFESSAPVGKNWLRIDGRDFLIEKVDYSDIEASLARLPQAAAVNQPGKAAMQAALRRGSREVLLADVRKAARRQPGGNGEAVQVAAVPKEPGFVLDYQHIYFNTTVRLKTLVNRADY